jgi:phenylalanyl-tRNA synthetase alpha chain
MAYQIVEALDKSGHYPEADIWMSHPVTDPSQNYDALLIPEDAPCRHPRYTRYLEDGRMLRTMTSELMPRLLKSYKQDALLVHPGICYRRDVRDKRHVAEPHQMDIWQLSSHEVTPEDLEQLVRDAIASILPHEYRLNPTSHPYTLNGLEIEMRVNDEWIEIGECGLIHPDLLPPERWGLAMGLGLDRLVMILKEIDDIRLLRSDVPVIAQQMKDLQPYKPVIKTTAMIRDISIATETTNTIEDITEGILTLLGDRAEAISEIQLISETPYNSLPPQSIERLNLQPHEKNVLVRLIIQLPNRNISKAEANELRDVILNKKEK